MKWLLCLQRQRQGLVCWLEARIPGWSRLGGGCRSTISCV